MIPGIKGGAKFTIETIIRDKNGRIKERTVEESEIELDK